MAKAFMKGFVVGAALSLGPVIAWIIYLERGWTELNERARLVEIERRRQNQGWGY